MSRSSNSARYGRLAEQRAAEKYGLDLEGHHASWKDGIRQNGDPVEIKAAIRKRANGSEGRFRIFEDPHTRLAQADGWYVFVAYTPRGNGIEVDAIRATRARTIRLSSEQFVEAGGHRDSRQVRIPISRIF